MLLWGLVLLWVLLLLCALDPAIAIALSSIVGASAIAGLAVVVDKVYCPIQIITFITCNAQMLKIQPATKANNGPNTIINILINIIR